MSLRLPSITDLDGSQQQVVRHTPYNDPMFVKGPPGSGKTHIAILRLNVLLQNEYTNVLFLLYNHSMYGFLNTIFRKMNLKRNVEINTKDVFFLDKAKAAGYNMWNENQNDLYNIKYSQRLGYVENHLPSGFYDVIVIDECQDFSERELKLLSRMTNTIIAVGDFEQSVYQMNGRAFLDKLPCKKLSTIYRYGRNVAAIAEHFTTTSGNLKSIVTNDNKTDVFKVKTNGGVDATDKIVRILNAKKNTDMTIAILSISKNQLLNLSSELLSRGVKTHHCSDNKNLRDYDFEQNLPLLLTAQSAKGMEFDCVILYGYNGILKSDFYISFWKEIVYVSLTRTCNELYLIEEPTTLPDLKNLSEWVELDSSRSNKNCVYDF
jgi:DNA helicase IV